MDKDKSDNIKIAITKKKLEWLVYTNSCLKNQRIPFYLSFFVSVIYFIRYIDI